MSDTPGGELVVGEQYYILASDVAAEAQKLVLKHDETFLVADRRGDFPNLPRSEFGLYFEGTRFLRQLELRVQGQRPLTLNAGVSEDALEASVDLTNPDVPLGPDALLPGRTIRLARRLTIYGDTLYQSIALETFAADLHELTVAIHFAADYVDVFEVRGHPRDRRGVPLPAEVERAAVRLGYRGLDGVERATRLAFEPRPSRLMDSAAEYRLSLAAGQRLEITVNVTAFTGDAAPVRRQRFGDAVTRRRGVLDGLDAAAAQVQTNHGLFDKWLTRSRRDIYLLLTETPDGFVPYAGIPWYVAAFGRDAVITALQLLPFEPEIARGTLRFLARNLGTVSDDFTDQEPGKVLHEYRRGEMAACREIPFIPYYGTVDATPLFLMLLSAYVHWTADVGFARSLWPAAERALAWMEANGAAHGAGYLTYHRRSARGLGNQGWKDSYDAVMHASGRLAEAPIALCEVQGYQYAALCGAAELADAVGESARAPALRQRAEQLRERFERDFWLPDEQFYALALDGAGRPCRVITSNPGHLLWTGIVSEARATLVARRLMADDVFTGWGLRTLASTERLYNPMSYHNGSVWPHDTAIAAAGMRRYNLVEPFMILANGLFDAVLQFENNRMPELYCGFPRVRGYAPTRYPVACAPQAWAAGVAFQVVAGMLGLVPGAFENQITLNRPALPSWLRWIELRGLGVHKSRLGLRVSQGQEGAAVELLGREGDAELVVRR